MKLSKENYQKARDFILTNARMIERRLFQYHFEGPESLADEEYCETRETAANTYESLLRLNKRAFLLGGVIQSFLALQHEMSVSQN